MRLLILFALLISFQARAETWVAYGHDPKIDPIQWVSDLFFNSDSVEKKGDIATGSIKFSNSTLAGETH